MLKCLTSEKINIGYSKFTFTYYSFFTLGTEVPGVNYFHKICMVVGYLPTLYIGYMEKMKKRTVRTIF